MVPGTLINADPQLTAQLQAIIDHPVAGQHPDLVHFRPLAAATGGGGAGPHGGAGSGTSSAAASLRAGTMPLAALAAVVLLAFGLCSGARLMARPPRGRVLVRRSLATLTAACGAVAVAALALGGPAPPHPAATSVASAAAPRPVVAANARSDGTTVAPAGLLMSTLRAHSLAVPIGSASPTWTSLVSIETSLTKQQDRVVSDEQQIASITRRLADDGAPSTLPGQRAHAAAGALQAALQRAVDDHQVAESDFDASLQNEYSFYVNAAQSPPATQQLQSIAAHVPPQVQTAITTDLNLVQTQLQQEAQIAAAADAAAAGAHATLLGGPASGPIDVAALARQTALRFHAPVSGVVTQPFGATSFALEPPVTYAGTFYPHFHTGLDIAAPLDTPVGAAASGTVILATSSVDSTGKLAGYGNYVVIAHGDGFETLYGHLDRMLVTPGETVQQGQVIGLLGSTGWSTGPHVHFEVRKNGVYIDPAPFLAAALQR